MIAAGRPAGVSRCSSTGTVSDLELCTLSCDSESASGDGVNHGHFETTRFGLAQCHDGEYTGLDYGDSEDAWAGKLPHCEYEYNECSGQPDTGIPDLDNRVVRPCEICSPESQQQVITSLTLRWDGPGSTSIGTMVCIDTNGDTARGKNTCRTMETSTSPVTRH